MSPGLSKGYTFRRTILTTGMSVKSPWTYHSSVSRLLTNDSSVSRQLTNQRSVFVVSAVLVPVLVPVAPVLVVVVVVVAVVLLITVAATTNVDIMDLLLLRILCIRASNEGS